MYSFLLRVERSDHARTAKSEYIPDLRLSFIGSLLLLLSALASTMSPSLSLPSESLSDICCCKSLSSHIMISSASSYSVKKLLSALRDRSSSRRIRVECATSWEATAAFIFPWFTATAADVGVDRSSLSARSAKASSPRLSRYSCSRTDSRDQLDTRAACVFLASLLGMLDLTPPLEVSNM